MRRIINFIVFILFISALLPNYSYSNKANNKQDKLALIVGIKTGVVTDFLFNNLNKIIESSSGKKGGGLVKELQDIYSSVKDTTDIIEYITVETQGKEYPLEVIITIKVKNKEEPYRNQIIIDNEVGIIPDIIGDEIKELCTQLDGRYENMYLGQIKTRLDKYYNREDLNFQNRKTMCLVLETIVSRLEDNFYNKKKFNKDKRELLYEYLKVLRLVINNTDDSEFSRKKIIELVKRIIVVLRSIKNNGLKEDIIYHLVFLYNRIQLDDAYIRNLNYIKKELIKKDSSFNEHTKVVYLARIARVVIGQKKYRNRKIDKEQLSKNFLRPIIQNFIAKLRNRKSQPDLELKKLIITKLIFLYENVGLTERDIKNLNYIKSKLMERDNKFEEDKRLENLKRVASLMVKEYKSNKKLIDEIIKGSKSAVSSSDNIKLSKNTIVFLGSVAKELIFKGYTKEADDLIIKPLKDISKASKKTALKIKIIDEFYFISRESFKKAIENREAGDTYLKQIIDIATHLTAIGFHTTKIKVRKQSIRRIADILILAKRHGLHLSNAEKLKKFIEANLKERSITNAVQRKLNQLKDTKKINVDQKREDKYRKEKKKDRRKKRYLKRVNKDLKDIDPKIIETTKRLIGEEAFEELVNKKYFDEVYKDNIVPIMKNLILINIDDKDYKKRGVYNGYEEFIEPVMSLRLEWKQLGINKSYKDLISSFLNLEKRCDMFLEYIDTHKSSYLESKEMERDVDYFMEGLDIIGLVNTFCSRIRRKVSESDFDHILKRFIYGSTISKRIAKEKQNLVRRGGENGKIYKELTILDEQVIKPCYSNIIPFTTPEGYLQKLEELGRIEIRDGYLINKVKTEGELPLNIAFDIDKKQRGSKKLFSSFEAFFIHMLIFKNHGSMKWKFLVDDKEVSKETRKIYEQVKEFNQWPKNRKDMEVLIKCAERLRELSGLRDLSNLNIIQIFFDELFETLPKAKKIIEYKTSEQKYRANKSIVEQIKESFDLLIPLRGTLKEEQLLEKIIFVLESRLTTEEIQKITNNLKDNQKLVFLVKDESVYEKYNNKYISFKSTAKRIDGQEVSFVQEYNRKSVVGMLNRISSKRFVRLGNDILILRPFGRISAVFNRRIIELKKSLVEYDVRPITNKALIRLINELKISRTKKELWQDKVKEFKDEQIMNYQNLKDGESNSIREMLLFFAVEKKDEELIRAIIKHGVCLDVWTAKRKNLFTMAGDIIRRGGKRDIFEFLVSHISRAGILDQKCGVDEKRENIKKDIEKYIKFLYKEEWQYFLNREIKIDIIKDFSRLQIFRRANDVIKVCRIINKKIKSVFREVVVNIYNNPDIIPSLTEFKALKKAV